MIKVMHLLTGIFQVHDREAPAPVRVCPNVRGAGHQGEHVPGIIITKMFHPAV